MLLSVTASYHASDPPFRCRTVAQRRRCMRSSETASLEGAESSHRTNATSRLWRNVSSTDKMNRSCAKKMLPPLALQVKQNTQCLLATRHMHGPRCSTFAQLKTSQYLTKGENLHWSNRTSI